MGLFEECQENETSGRYCIRNQLVYRMSFSICVFFTLTALLSCLLGRGFRENCCCVLFFQLPFYILLVFGSLLLPNRESYLNNI